MLKSLGNLRRQEVVINIKTWLKHQNKNSPRYMTMDWNKKQKWYSKTATQVQNTTFFFVFHKIVYKFGENEQSHWIDPKAEKIRSAP